MNNETLYLTEVGEMGSGTCCGSSSVHEAFVLNNIKDKVDEVEKPYEWAHDEWYYEEEIEDYKYWKAEEEKAANEQRLLKLAKKHKKQLASMSRLNSFDDQSYDDLFQSDKENFEALDYEDAHLGMSFERSPKIALLDS
ncbi:hypothetical protein Tco_0645788 [Tanacetum coccineum]